MTKLNLSDISISQSQNQYTVFELYGERRLYCFQRRYNLFGQWSKKHDNREYINWYNNDAVIHYSIKH